MEKQDRPIVPGANSELLRRVLAEMSGLPEVETDVAETDERQDIELDRLRMQLEDQKEDLQGKRQDRLQRKDFAIAIFGMMWLYMFIALAIVITVGNGNLELSDTILTVLLGTTAANIIGSFNFVAKYLFHSKD